MWKSDRERTAKPNAMSQRASYRDTSWPTSGRKRITTNPPGESAIPACCAL